MSSAGFSILSGPLSVDKSGTRSYGVSVPLSIESPSSKDRELTERLEETLKKFQVFESDSELRHRMDVLHKINALFKEWIKRVSISKVGYQHELFLFIKFNLDLRNIF